MYTAITYNSKICCYDKSITEIEGNRIKVHNNGNSLIDGYKKDKEEGHDVVAILSEGMAGIYPVEVSFEDDATIFEVIGKDVDGVANFEDFAPDSEGEFMMYFLKNTPRPKGVI